MIDWECAFLYYLWNYILSRWSLKIPWKFLENGCNFFVWTLLLYDCFFWLQLRFLQNKPSQLIYYERDDKSGPKMSDYFITTTNEPEDLANVLLQALGEKGKVISMCNDFFCCLLRMMCLNVFSFQSIHSLICLTVCFV